MVASKNILSRRRIRRALPLIDSPFTTKQMATASGEGINRVGGLLRGMDGIRKEQVPRGHNTRVLWHYEPEESSHGV